MSIFTVPPHIPIFHLGIPTLPSTTPHERVFLLPHLSDVPLRRRTFIGIMVPRQRLVIKAQIGQIRHSDQVGVTRRLICASRLVPFLVWIPRRLSIYELYATLCRGHFLLSRAYDVMHAWIRHLRRTHLFTLHWDWDRRATRVTQWVRGPRRNPFRSNRQVTEEEGDM
jgi:hypothetical protein